MSPQQIQDQIDAIRTVCARLVAEGPDACRKFLEDAGIISKSPPQPSIDRSQEGEKKNNDSTIAELYAWKDACVQLEFRIKVLEKEIETAKQVAHNFLEQNVLLVDERDRLKEVDHARGKAHAIAFASYALGSVSKDFSSLLGVYDQFEIDEAENNRKHKP
jgi:regulator of replication initiation timing